MLTGVLRRRSIAGLLTIASLLILNSCSIFQVEPGAPPNAIDQRALYRVKAWNLQGRIGIRSKLESTQANLVWKHDLAEDRLTISGPFGQGAVAVFITEDFIRIRYADGKVDESENPNQLLYSLLGVEIPLETLQYWVLGVANPNIVFSENYDASGWLRQLKQLGWVIDLVEYQRAEKWVLPRKLKIVKGDARVVLVIDEWSIKG